MIKEIIGAASAFFVLLPFLLINRRILKVEKQSRFAFLFLIVNTIQAAALTLLAYSLYSIGQRTLIGLIVVFCLFLFIFLVLFFSRKKNRRNAEESEEDLFSTQKIDRGQLNRAGEEASVQGDDAILLEEDLILEDDEATLAVEEPDFSQIEKKAVAMTLEDIFKEK